MYKPQVPIFSRKTLIEKLSNGEFTFIFTDRNTAVTRNLLAEPEFVFATENQGFETRRNRNSAARTISQSSRNFVIAANSLTFGAMTKLHENLIAESDSSQKMHSCPFFSNNIQT